MLLDWISQQVGVFREHCGNCAYKKPLGSECGSRSSNSSGHSSTYVGHLQIRSVFGGVCCSKSDDSYIFADL